MVYGVRCHDAFGCPTLPCSLAQLLDGWLTEDVDGFGSAAHAARGGSQLTLAVPGLTIPWAHAGYLWMAAALSLCVHEVSLWVAARYACRHLVMHLRADDD